MDPIKKWTAILGNQEYEPVLKDLAAVSATGGVPESGVGSLYAIRTALQRRDRADDVSDIEYDIAQMEEDAHSKKTHDGIHRVAMILAEVSAGTRDETVRMRSDEAFAFAVRAHIVTAKLPDHLRELRARLLKILETV